LTIDGPGLGLPFVKHRGQSAGHLLPVLLPRGKSRIKFMEHMKSKGIQTSIHYPPAHGFSYYRRSVEHQPLPVTEEVAAREVTLPLHPLLSEAQVGEVVAAVTAALQES